MNAENTAVWKVYQSRTIQRKFYVMEKENFYRYQLNDSELLDQ